MAELGIMTAETIHEAAINLAAFDAGHAVWSASMGGLGPSYEQCIQDLMIEIVRGAVVAPPSTQAGWDSLTNAAVAKLNPTHGFSGAQVGAAKNLAYQLCVNGWDKSLHHPSLEPDRRIQIDNRMKIVANAAD